MARATVTGINQVNANIQRLQRNVVNKVKIAVQESALDLQGKAQLRAPIDTGDLRGSASTNVTETNNKITATVGFNEPYALRQHEELSYNHPRGGEAKYLENPMKENEQNYIRHIQNSVRNGVT